MVDSGFGGVFGFPQVTRPVSQNRAGRMGDMRVIEVEKHRIILGNCNLTGSREVDQQNARKEQSEEIYGRLFGKPKVWKKTEDAFLVNG